MPDLCETNFHKIRLFDECNEIFCENAFTKNVALYRALKCSGILTPCTGRVFNIKTLPVFFIRRLDMNEKKQSVALPAVCRTERGHMGVHDEAELRLS